MSEKHTTCFKDGTKEERWLDYKGRTHRWHRPSLITYYATGEKEYEAWSLQDLPHCTFGPSHISYNKDGSIRFVGWSLHGVPCDDFNDWVKGVRLTKKKQIELKLMYG